MTCISISMQHGGYNKKWVMCLILSHLMSAIILVFIMISQFSNYPNHGYASIIFPFSLFIHLLFTLCCEHFIWITLFHRNIYVPAGSAMYSRTSTNQVNIDTRIQIFVNRFLKVGCYMNSIEELKNTWNICVICQFFRNISLFFCAINVFSLHSVQYLGPNPNG